MRILSSPNRNTGRHSEKRIAIFLPAMHEGGAERTMAKLSGGIAERGYSVDLVLAQAEGPHLADVSKSVRIIDLQARRVITSLPGLVQYIRHERPNAMLSAMNHANIIALVARRLAGVPMPVAVSERNTLSISARRGTSLRARSMPYLIRRLYPAADSIVAVSEGVADDLASLSHIPRDRVRVIYNPVVTPEFCQETLAPLDHPWFGTGQPPVILGVGRLKEQKDFSTLIRAFACVRHIYPCRLIILGEGPELPVLEALARQLGIAEDVNLPGFIGNPYPYMRRASVFVLSSRWEGLPGVLIEALYCGVPVISTDCPSGPREILEAGHYGPLVSVGDVNGMANAIRDALEGRIPKPPKESWLPFERERIVDQYVDVLLERSSCAA